MFTIGLTHPWADEVTREVNPWAENATNGLIKELLPLGSLTNETALVLANALYFKGAWAKMFDAFMTTPKDFHLLNGQTTIVPFMTSNPYEKHFYKSFDDFKILQIPYQLMWSRTSEIFNALFPSKCERRLAKSNSKV